MTRPVPARVVAVTAATLVGAATAYVVPGLIEPVREPHAASSTDSSPPKAAAAGSTRPEPAAASPLPAARPQAPAPRQPARLAVDRLGIDMAIRAEGVDAQGRMALPEDPRVAGWYRYGPAPSEATGAVVIAAHVDSRSHGIGPFARLRTLRPGDRIVVDDGATSWRYQVERIDRIDKDGSELAAVFARDGAPRLHVVTCTGRYDRGSGYTANLVVVAARSPGGA